MHTKFMRKIDWLMMIILIISLPMVFGFSLISADPHHCGLMFKSALDVSRGQILFKDTFTMYGALTTWIHALFIKIFGEYLWAINLATALFYSGSYALIYLIGKRFVPKGIAFLASMITLFMGNFFIIVVEPWNSVMAVFFLLASIYGIILFVGKKSEKYLSFSVTFVALCFWARQTVGIVVLAAWLLSYILLVIAKKQGSKKCFCISIGTMAGVHLGFLLVIFIQGALKDWYIQTIASMWGYGYRSEEKLIVYLFKCLFMEPFKEHSSAIYGNVYSVMRDSIYGVLPVLCLSLFFVFFFKILYNLKKGKEISEETILLEIYLLFSLASWHQYFPATGHGHWYWAAFPMFFVSVWGIYRAVEYCGRKTKKLGGVFCIITALIVILIYLPNIMFRLQMGEERIAEHNITMHHSKYPYTNGLKFNEQEIEFYTALYDSITQVKEMYPEKNIINMTWDGFFATFSDYNVHPQFNYGTWTIHTTYWTTMDEYITHELPIIIGYDNGNMWWGLYEEYIDLPGSMGNDWNPYKVIIQIPES